MHTSSGLLIYRRREGLEVFLVVPGGPYWRSRDHGAWQIPKGEVRSDEDMLEAALREFEEEIGVKPRGHPRFLTRLRQAGGKRVEVFTLESDIDPADLVSNRFEMEWPPHSGIRVMFPEVDRAAWFPIGEAETKMLVSQAPLLDALVGAIPLEQTN